MRGPLNRLLVNNAIKAASANPFVFKRLKSDFPEDPHGTQKPMDPKQTGGFGDVFINEGIAKKTPPRTPQDFANPDLTKLWHSHGMDTFDQTADRFYMHLASFLFLTCMWCVFFISKWYRHDEPLNDWALREAYFEIERREKLGLPLIDKNYIPPEKVNLPTEEELEGRQVYY